MGKRTDEKRKEVDVAPTTRTFLRSPSPPPLIPTPESPRKKTKEEKIIESIDKQCLSHHKAIQSILKKSLKDITGDLTLEVEIQKMKYNQEIERSQNLILKERKT